MNFKTPLLKGIFLKRYKRFFADFELDGKVEIAHVPNTGSMKSCNTTGSPCLVKPSDNPERKLKFTLEAIQVASGSWVGVNTSYPNLIVQEAFKKNKISAWKKFTEIKSEVKINAETRLDLMLKNDHITRYVEIKNVSMMVEKNGEKVASFPDAVTVRGQKHLKELIELKEKGFEAEILFTVQRTDCKYFCPADDIDPDYGILLRQAQSAGVIVTAYVIAIDESKIELIDQPLKVVL